MAAAHTLHATGCMLASGCCGKATRLLAGVASPRFLTRARADHSQRTAVQLAFVCRAAAAEGSVLGFLHVQARCGVMGGRGDDAHFAVLGAWTWTTPTHKSTGYKQRTAAKHTPSCAQNARNAALAAQGGSCSTIMAMRALCDSSSCCTHGALTGVLSHSCWSDSCCSTG